MKKSFLFVCALCTLGSAVGQEPFTIEGHVPALADSAVLELTRSEGSVLRTVDTARVSDGRFSFSFPVGGKEKMAILGRSEGFSGAILDVWAAPGVKAVVRGDNYLIGSWNIDSPIPEQQQTEYYKRGVKAESEESQRIRLQMDELRAAGVDRSRIEESFREPITAAEYRRYDKTLDLLAAAEPSDIFLDELWGVALMVFHYEPYADLRPRAIEQYNRLTDELKGSVMGREVTRFLFPPKEVEAGGEMADDALPDLSGTMHRLSDYKGKYVLLDFWAAWCGPCRMAMPEVGELSKKYADRLTVIGINSDTSHRIWAEASEESNITWVNLNAPGQSEIAAKYKVSGIPHQVLISPEGVVLGAWTGYRKGNLHEQLKKYAPELE